jgi:hypothetical protein
MFADLAAIAEKMPIASDVQPKEPSAYRVLGCEGRLRVDTPGKILGTTQFAIDVNLPDMLARSEAAAARRRWTIHAQIQNRCAELGHPHRRWRTQQIQLASGNGSARRLSARRASVCKVFPWRQAFQALMAMATSASRPDRVEY